MKRFLTLLTVLTGCAPATTAGPALERGFAAVIDSVISTPPLHHVQWGVLVVDAESGRTLYAHEAQQNHIPASNTKLVVTAVALGTLGPDWRYETELRASSDGRLLVVRGSGDPTLSARFFGEPFAALDSLARSTARVLGVNALTGVAAVIDTLIIDASRFPGPSIPDVWEVGDLPWRYAPPTGAFGVEESNFMFVLSPGERVAAPARWTVQGTSAQPVVVDVTTDTAGARTRVSIDYLDHTDTVFVRGSIGLGAAADTSILSVTDADEFGARTLADALRRASISVGAVRVVRDSAEAARLAAATSPLFTHTSPPMSEIVAAILQPSQNWIAEQLLRTLGAEYRDDGTWRGGLAVEREYLVQRAGVDSLGFALYDGSGMAARNVLAPETIVRLLAHARAQPWAHVYRHALAQPGLDDSTLESRLPELEGRLFAKTGIISNVSTLSGYLVNDAGRELLFSIMTNGTGLPSALVRNATDRIVEAIARSATP